MSHKEKSAEQLQTEPNSVHPENSALKDKIAEHLPPDLQVIQARLAAIVESSDDAIVSKTLEGIIVTWNGGAQRIFGWSAEEVIGKPINIIIPPDRQDEEPKILEQIRSGRRIDHFETVRLTKDGKQINVSVTISPMRDSNGVIVGASKIARDITLQKQIQRELEEARDAAEAANKAKDHFLSVLSHELRTPLTPVLGSLSYLERQPEIPEELRSELGMLKRNVQTEARRVDDLLDLTRISRGKMKLHLEVADLHEALRASINMMQSEIDAKDLELTTALRAKSHHVWADTGRLQQIFLNLISNAVKFTPNGGSIVVRTSNQGERLISEVSDTGVGIHPEMLGRLFDAFEQSEDSRKMGGLGLGLSISKSLMEMHGGTLTAASAGVGKGATLRVELKTIPWQADTAAPSAGLMPLVSRCRVLLVEDHSDTRKVMVRLLKSFGCTVTEASTVAEALAAADRADFDVLLSDIGLPDGSGTEIMHELKARKPIRGIAVSGYGQDSDLQRSREAGFDLHLIKPVNLQTLRDSIRRVTAA